MRYISARSVRFIFSQAFWIASATAGSRSASSPYEVVDREKNDRTDERANKACRLTRVIQT
jgi:hypothetical protein